eukprot:TRINITY_DN31225_c0_g1_i1.p1 TRINITY_DN31225_c0_g1~~TRINITY_DN31225_c0_g1_i1.p1  ORF type:complete len:309 (+),score=135.28 TRINITY_DN31225_c0_g1_i1:79-1005(+)
MAPKKAAKKKDAKAEEVKEEEVVPELPDGPKSIAVGGWSSAKDINDAVEKAAEGDLIILNSDNFDAPAVIDKNITLKGGAGDAPVIRGGMVIRAEKVTLEGVRFESSLTVEQGKHAVSNCEFDGNTNLLCLWPYSDTAVSGCKFTTRGKAAIYSFSHAKGSITKCEITGDPAQQGTSGIVLDNSCTIIDGNTISGTTTGVYCFCADAAADKAELNSPVIKNNTINGVSGTGVHLDKGANCTFTNNTITNSAYWAVNVSEKATGTFTKNAVHDKVRIRAGCRPLLAQNKITARVINENDVGTISMQERY